jgi:sulfur relay (sulfurtransferase) complex TusBCD TusD component (DsrE family)
MSKTWIEQYLEETADVEICPYCMNDRGGKMSCCGEVHFMKFSELHISEQLEIAKQEWEMAHKDQK